jgi:hypothetical protein
MRARTGHRGTASDSVWVVAGGNNVQSADSLRPYGRPMSITAHIVVQGAERAVAFYRDAFGAQEISRIPVPDGRLMSVQRQHLRDVPHDEVVAGAARAFA